jgi:hypothetical protein
MCTYRLVQYEFQFWSLQFLKSRYLKNWHGALIISIDLLADLDEMSHLNNSPCF